MDRCWSFWISGDETTRRKSYLSVVQLLAAGADMEVAQFCSGTVDSMKIDGPGWQSVSGSELENALLAEMVRKSGSENIFGARIPFVAWKVSNIVVSAPLSQQRRSEWLGQQGEWATEVVDVSYYGLDARSAGNGYTPRYELGDVCISAPGYIFESLPESASHGNSDVQAMSEVHRADDMARATRLLISALCRADAENCLVVPSMLCGDGALAASHIYHREVVEFVRDLARALFLMEDRLKSSVERPIIEAGNRAPPPPMCYFDDYLRVPNRLSDVTRLLQLRDNCRRFLERSRLEGLGGCRTPACAIELLALCREDGLLARLLNNPSPSRILEVLLATRKATVTTVAGGCLVKHRRVVGDDCQGMFDDTIYSDLLRAALGGYLVA
jgi:hypothetical protein